MSEVETYWEAIRNKVDDPKPPEWHKLGTQKQQMVLHSINLLLRVVYDEQE